MNPAGTGDEVGEGFGEPGGADGERGGPGGNEVSSEVSSEGEVGEPPSRTARTTVSWIGLVGGPLAALVVYLLLPDTFADPQGGTITLGHAGRATAAVAVWMAVWWMTEAIEIFATALLPLALFPLLGATDIDQAAEPYANPLIFLFLGGFLLALSMQKWGLERRVALLALRVVGTRPRQVVGGIMVMTAVFSMWVSNTATVAMMLPVALSIIDTAVPGGRSVLLEPGDHEGRNFARSLLLGIAVSASIGGVGTLIGTPPNLFLASFARDNLGVDISFAQWMLIGVPLVVVFLPLAWALLVYVLFPPDVDSDQLREALGPDAREDLGAMSRGEWSVLVIFACTALAWVFRPLLEDWVIGGWQPFDGLTDAGIAVLAGVALFAVPVDVARREFVLDWKTAVELPWGVLLLFGGGLSLAAAFDANGVADFLGAQAVGLDVLPTLAIIMIVTAGVVFLTELTSNTATAAALIPIFAAIGPGLGIDPLGLAVPAAIAASLAFMLPVATPPNAIVFGSGYVELPDMMRVGLRLNIASVMLVTAATYLLAGPVLGLDLSVT